jgi:hypothetical protein
MRLISQSRQLRRFSKHDSVPVRAVLSRSGEPLVIGVTPALPG